jgi:putative SOS response-associated peptidase YedK
MCGRYVNISKIKAVEKRFSALVERPDLYAPNTNTSIGDLGAVITQEHPGVIKHYRFGFTPYWAKKPFHLFNARSEGDHNSENDPLTAAPRALPPSLPSVKVFAPNAA